jgi:hypothetical protein
LLPWHFTVNGCFFFFTSFVFASLFIISCPPQVFYFASFLTNPSQNQTKPIGGTKTPF